VFAFFAVAASGCFMSVDARAASLSFTTEPANALWTEGSLVRLAAVVAGANPHFQWFKEESPVAGGTTDTLTFTSISRTNAGHYRLIASNESGAITSQVATLPVWLKANTNPPVLISAGPASDGPGLIVIFDHSMDSFSGTDKANYSITRAETGASVVISNLTTYGLNAFRLIPGLLEPGVNYILTVNNIKDTHNVSVRPNSRVTIPSTVPLLSIDATWSYNDSGVEPGSNWREINFDDSTWPSGQALFVNDQNFTTPTGTVIRTQVAVTNSAGPVITHYFRGAFQVNTLPTSGAALKTRFLADDGAIVSLNGQEIARYNMPTGEVNAATRASASGTESVWIGNLADAGPLVLGRNVMSVEVHQFSLASPNFPDISFALEASVQADSWANTPPIVLRQPTSLALAEHQTGSFFADVMAATDLQWLRNGVPIPGANRRTLNLPPVSATDDGALFSLSASNSLGAVLTDAARLTVRPDRVGPQLRGANMGTNRSQIVVTFSENLDPVTSQEIARYHITNEQGQAWNIISATQTNGGTVVLTTEPRTNGIHFVLSVDGVRDTAVAGNAVHDSCPVGYEVLHLAWDDVWKYDDSGTDLSTSWRNLDFDDSPWPQGPGLLGFEDMDTPPPEPVRTMLIPPNYRGVTYYFRKLFDFTPDPAASAIWLRYFIDDGAVFYLNGQEVRRVAVPTNQIFSTLATRSGDAFLEGPYTIPASAFASGTNLFAVEVHQVTATSDDSVFGLQLTESFDVQPLRPVRPPIEIRRDHGLLLVSWEDLASILETSETPVGPWVRAPQPTLPYPISADTPARFFRLAK
jgi:hypothetical protein